VVEFDDFDVESNDFYYIAVRQKGQMLVENDSIINNTGDEYMAFFGPVFIKNVQN